MYVDACPVKMRKEYARREFSPKLLLICYLFIYPPIRCILSLQEKERLQTLARDRAEEVAMTEELPWDAETLRRRCSREEVGDAGRFERDVERRLVELSATEGLILESDAEWERPQRGRRHYHNYIREGEEREGGDDGQGQGQGPAAVTEDVLAAAKESLMDKLTFPPLRESLKEAKAKAPPRGDGSPTVGLIPFPDDKAQEGFNFSFDAQPELSDDYEGPSPALLLQVRRKT